MDLDRFDLEPWQRQVIEAQLRDERVMMSGPRQGRQHVGDCLAAAVLATGVPVNFTSTSPARAEEARQRALALLDGLDP
jgi:hypothetical protein